MARLRADRDQRRQAHDLLAEVYDWFTEGFGTPDLKEARMLLDSLASAPLHPTSDAAATLRCCGE